MYLIKINGNVVSAQRRMASEDVSHPHRAAGATARHVLNAGWRLRMFHVPLDHGSRRSSLVLNAGWRLRMFHEIGGAYTHQYSKCSTPDGV